MMLNSTIESRFDSFAGILKFVEFKDSVWYEPVDVYMYKN